MTDKSLGIFINPFTDFGSKKIFGSEESKPLLISFLNDLLPIKNKIVSLEFKNIEKLPSFPSATWECCLDRVAVCDAAHPRNCAPKSPKGDLKTKSLMFSSL